MSWAASSKGRGLKSKLIGEETEQDKEDLAFGRVLSCCSSKEEKLKSPAPSKNKSDFPQGHTLTSQTLPSVRRKLSSHDNIPDERRTHLFSLV